MPTVKETVEVNVEVDFDLSNYESEIESEYCCGNCLREDGLRCNLEEYVENLRKELYIFPESNKKLKTVEEIYNDLDYMLKEN